MALLAITALGWCAPSRAVASCGDYVTMGHGHGQPVAQGMPIVPLFDTDSRTTDDLFTQPQLGDFSKPSRTPPPLPCQRCPREPGKPCQGPWCSGDPVPLPAPPSTVDHVQQQWACWWAALLGVDSRRIGSHVFHDEQDRIHHVFPIYHPPRPI